MRSPPHGFEPSDRQHRGMPTNAAIDPATATLQRAERALIAVPPARKLASLPDELDALAVALRRSTEACARAAGRVAPAASIDHSICDRDQRVAASWPVQPPPSRERFAGLLTARHEAASTVALAAHRCDEAKRALDDALHPGNEPPGAA
jgi:hypothetical protein